MLEEISRAIVMRKQTNVKQFDSRRKFFGNSLGVLDQFFFVRRKMNYELQG